MRRALVIACSLLAACNNLHTVESGRYYRSGQMNDADTRSAIDEFGIKTMLRLRGSGHERAKALAEEAGIDFVQIRMSANDAPPRDVLIRLWEAYDNASYPILVNCQAGADRTGLASAIYVLHRTGDLRAAKEQLHLIPYLHLGWGSTDAMDRVLEQYEPYHGALTFGDWAREIYADPGS